MCYGYRDQLSAGIICAGWDKREGGQVQSLGQKRKGVVCVCVGGGGGGGSAGGKIKRFVVKNKGGVRVVGRCRGGGIDYFNLCGNAWNNRNKK